MKRSIILAALLLISTATFGQPAKRKLTLDDVLAVKEVADPQLSPDEEWIAYTVAERNLAEDESRSHIWLTRWDGTRSMQLTFSDSSESSPQWSPNGLRLAFLSSRGSEDDLDQLWIINRDGGEAEKVSDFKGGVSDFHWAPDGKRIVVAAQDPDPEAASEDKEKKKKKTKPPIVLSRFHFKQDVDGYLTTRRHHLYLLDAGTRKHQQLTAGDYDEYLPSVSPNGRELAFVSKRGDDPDRANNWDIFVMEMKPGASASQVTTFAGADNDPYEGTRPSWSADGKSIAYVRGGPPELIYYGINSLAVISSTGGDPAILTATLDRNIRDPQFSPDGKWIWFIRDDDRVEMLERIPAAGGKRETILGGKRDVARFDASNDRAVALVTDAMHPAELFAVRDAASQLTRHNAEMLSPLDLGTVEEIEFPSSDGTRINGFVVKPPGYVAGSKYPAILRIHGGPVSQYLHEFMPDWQLLAASGYVVIGCNPRGSSGRGQQFARAIFADWGNKDAQDVLAAVDHVVARGLADPNRLGIGGWSYGGILTNYVITRDQRFKAATSGAAASNILAGYGTDMYVREYEGELGKPWEKPETWIRLSSPFLQANRIKTPTLFLATEKDFNVPLLNSEQMYQALRSLGIPTQLVIYPDESHTIKKPSYEKDRLARYVEWYRKYLGSE